VTQYNVEVSHTCTGKILVGLTLAASNWNPVNFWNLQSTATSAGHATLSLNQYTAISTTGPLTVGYQNVGPQASFVVTSFTFQ
jgi:anti-sigma-K factor RskA